MKKNMRNLILKLIFFLSTFISLSIATATDTLTPTKPLSSGEILRSANKAFTLSILTSSNYGYVGITSIFTNQTVVWVANRNYPIGSVSSASLSIGSDGILTITEVYGDIFPIWSSSLTSITARRNISNPIAQILDTGNFVVREANSLDQTPLWQSFDYPTDTLLPGMKLGWDLKTGLNRNLTAGSFGDDKLESGKYTVAMQIQGDPQIFLSSGSSKIWTSGTWNGAGFSGMPETSLYISEFVQNEDEVYYTFKMRDPSDFSWWTVNNTGFIERLTFGDLLSVAPADQCDVFPACGPFAICNSNGSTACDCIQGFVPKVLDNWDPNDSHHGCSRKTSLDCKNKTDRFVSLSQVKLPDTSRSTMDKSTNLTLDKCRAKCLENCSCTAYASANMNGTGCIFWTADLTDIRKIYGSYGQDLYIRLAAVDLGLTPGGTTSKQRHISARVIAATVVTVVIGALLVLCYCFWRKKKRIRRGRGTFAFKKPLNNGGTEDEDLELPLFDLSTIVAATNNFSMENKLGQGGFGPVFKGKLEEGGEIAVKRLAKTSAQGVDEFKNEVMLIAKLQHRNLVRLLGCCIHEEERMLIYEYMPNNNLDKFLFDKEKCIMLDWQTRYNIITGIARGLLYLHQDSRFRIIHRDLKPSNILLDEKMTPKISDFGMARVFGGDETEVNTRKVVGTYGYMSPEYAMNGFFSIKSDVFSFGVLVLEIISGKKNREIYFGEPDVNLLGHAWNLWNEDHGLALVEESLGSSFPMTEVLKCINLGLLCVQNFPEDRPTMTSVVSMLGSESMTLTHPKQPGFVGTRGPYELHSSEKNQAPPSINYMSTSILKGR